MGLGMALQVGVDSDCILRFRVRLATGKATEPGTLLFPKTPGQGCRVENPLWLREERKKKNLKKTLTWTMLTPSQAQAGPGGLGGGLGEAGQMGFTVYL